MRTLVIVSLLALSCVTARATTADSTATRNVVAIMDFKNNGHKDYDYLKSSLSSMLATTFALSNRIQVVERSQLKKIVSEMKIGMSGLVDAKQAAHVGKVAGANMVVLGSFTNLGAAIRVDAKVINVETGIIIPKATASAKADKIDQLDVAMDSLARVLLANLTGEELRPPKAAAAVKDAEPAAVAQRVEGYVIEVDGNTIAVNIGTEKDLAPGMVLAIFEETTKVDPNTGAITGKTMTRLGEATITKVLDKMAVCQVTSQRPGTTFRAGNKVLLKRN
jgi:TolB-like protein